MTYKTITVISFIVTILLAGNSYGQDEKKGPYKRFKSSSTSVRNATTLLAEANELKNNQPAEALNKVEEALGLSVAQGDRLNEGKSYVMLGEINEGILEWKLAIDNYTRAYEKLTSAYSSTSEYRKTLQGLGNSNLKIGEFEEALKFYNEALSVVPGNTNSGNYSEERQLDISEVYYQMGNYYEALKTVETITTSRKQINSSLHNRLQNQKAKVNARLNETNKTQNIYQNSLNTLRSNKTVDPLEQQSLQDTKEEIANVLHGQQKYDEEINLRNQAIEYNLQSNNLTEVTKDKIEISKALAVKGDNRAALKELEEAALIADEQNDPREQANALLALANQYDKNGRTRQALDTYKKYGHAVVKTQIHDDSQLLEKSLLIKKQNDIEQLSKDVSLGKQEETLEQATIFRQQLIIYGLFFIILIIGVTYYFIYKNIQASKLANRLLALKSLRSQMNPHFIFNALNSVNQFITQLDERTANKFLSEFSQLMRLVLENSQEDFIPFHKEQEILSLYLKLEHYRFRDKFDYEILSDPEINIDSVLDIPPMLIQPYIENAVWHGLRYKENKGKLMLHFYKESETLMVEITDNGIGRKKSAELKTENQKKHNSTGLKNIQERLLIINKVYKTNYRITVHDLEGESGTRVLIYLPINNQTNNQQ